MRYIAVQPNLPSVLPTTTARPSSSAAPLSEGFLARSNEMPEVVGRVDPKSLERRLPAIPPFYEDRSHQRRWVIRHEAMPGERPTYYVPALMAHVVPAFQCMLDDLYRLDSQASSYVTTMIVRRTWGIAPYASPHTDFENTSYDRINRFTHQYTVSNVSGTRHYPHRLTESDMPALIRALDTENKQARDPQLTALDRFYLNVIGQQQGIGFGPGEVVRASPYAAHGAPAFKGTRHFIRVDFNAGPNEGELDDVLSNNHPALHRLSDEMRRTEISSMLWMYYPERYIARLQVQRQSPGRFQGLKDMIFSDNMPLLDVLPAVIRARGLVSPRP